LLTFVATNVAAGDTNVTFQETGNYGAYAISILEYSGDGATLPIDQFTFASTVVGSGNTSLSSGSIATKAGDLVFSAAFGMADPLTITPGAGYTQRAAVAGNMSRAIALQVWDQTSTGGSYSNNISASTDPGTMHVVVINLSLTAITRTIVQGASFVAAQLDVNAVSVAYPLNNVAGNTLVAFGRMVERTDGVITDTQGNSWIMVYTDPAATNDTIVAAYCIGCKAGANTVTLTSTAGGTDDTMMLIIAEYPAVESFISSSKSYPGTQTSSVNTGSIPGPGLLVSMFSSSGLAPTDLSCTPPLAQLATLRYQFSDGGFLAQQPCQMGIADQIATVPGFYNNVFTLPSSTAIMAGAILGFAFSGPPPSQQSVRCANVQLSGAMFTGELTRDLDADWSDESTIFITQCEPLPFTLRGLAIRESENQD
jgi:hypothetical protein